MAGADGTGGKQRTMGWALLLLVLALWVHDPRGMHFKADDYPTIAYSRDFGRVLHDFVGSQYDLSFFVFHRPLVTLSLWGDFQLFGTRATGFFLMNLLAFVLSLVLLQRILALGIGGLRGELGGLVLALLWLFHPVPIASLEWVVGRVDTHVVPWILAALYFQLRARRGGPSWPVWVCSVFALLTKESALGLPLLLLGVDFLDSRPREAGWRGSLLQRLPSLPVLLLIPLDLLFRWAFLGQVLGGYGFLKVARLDFPAMLSGFANTLSLSLYPRDVPSPFLHWGLPILLLLGVLFFCFKDRKASVGRLAGVCLLVMGLFGPLALLLPSMRDPANQRYAYLACLAPWLGILALFQLPSRGSRLRAFSPVLLFALVWLLPAQEKERERMAVHDRFVAQTVRLLREAASRERGRVEALPLVLSGRAEAACHPQRFLWGLGSVLRPPFVEDPGLQRAVVSLRPLHPSATRVPEALVAAGLKEALRVGGSGDGLRLVSRRPQGVREAHPLGFDGRLSPSVREQARTLGEAGPGFALGPKFGGEVALCTSLGSYLLELPPHPRDRLSLWEILTRPIQEGGAPLPGLWILWNAFDLCPEEALQLFWREGDQVVHARLWVDRAFTKELVRAMGEGER